MLSKKIYLFIITVFFFAACGSDDSNSGILRYIEASSGVESYTLYVGSETGGYEVHTDSIINRINLIFPTTVFESYSNTTITFWNESVIIEQSGSPAEKSLFKFEDNSLYIFNEDVPVYVGDGDKKALNIRQHYIAYKQPGDKTYQNIAASPQKNIDKDKAAAESPFGTIADMKSVEDTLVWCTRISAFR